MKLQVNGIKIDKNRTHVTARSNKESDKLELGMIFKHPQTNLVFILKEIDIKTNHQADLLLEQTGSWHNRIKDSTTAYGILYDRIEIVTNKEELTRINKAACYC